MSPTAIDVVWTAPLWVGFAAIVAVPVCGYLAGLVFAGGSSGRARRGGHLPARVTATRPAEWRACTLCDTLRPVDDLLRVAGERVCRRGCDEPAPRYASAEVGAW
jgi:hypothetical protein